MKRKSVFTLSIVASALGMALATLPAHAWQQAPAPAQPSAQPAPMAPAPKAKPSDEKAQGDNPFAPAKPEPLPPGMTGSDPNDPRTNLKSGMFDAGETAKGMEHIRFVKKPEAFMAPVNDDAAMQKTLGQLGVPAAMVSKIPKEMQSVIAELAYANSDIAFQGNHLFLGNFYGINFYDISDPAKTSLITSLICPGGQGDVSIYNNLLFMSDEMPNGRVDCGAQGFPPNPPPPAGHEKDPQYRMPAAQKDRFRGVRIFDISDIRNPKQVAVVQTCRGSHTHTLVTDPKDPANVYIYVSGTSFVRQSDELAGCSNEKPDKDPNTSLFRIDVIKVPVSHPQDAKIVSSPRVFMDARTGAINGLNNGGSHGSIEGEKKPQDTDQCHDITVYPSLGLAAGACSGNGILLDISNPADPKRVDAVNDPNYSYWHSATFNNDGTKVVFTDEWGGGMGARCRATDPNVWGADAIFSLKNEKLAFDGYYKMPAAQGDTKNCVAHNGSLVPVPGRDIEVQAWYQGGVSVMDFTDPKHPKEIAYFSRGAISDKQIVLGGDWSAYWYNGNIYGSEIARGLDVFKLLPTADLSQNEIDAAKQVQVKELNVQDQQKIVWPDTMLTARAYVDQLERSKALPAAKIAQLRQATAGRGKKESQKLAASLNSGASSASNDADANRMRALARILGGGASATASGL